VIAGAEIGALGDADPIAESDLGEIVDPGVFPKPASFTNFQPPGELHTQAWLDATTSADLCPEASEQPDAPGRPW